MADAFEYLRGLTRWFMLLCLALLALAVTENPAVRYERATAEMSVLLDVVSGRWTFKARSVASSSGLQQLDRESFSEEASARLFGVADADPLVAPDSSRVCLVTVDPATRAKPEGAETASRLSQPTTQEWVEWLNGSSLLGHLYQSDPAAVVDMLIPEVPRGGQSGYEIVVGECDVKTVPPTLPVSLVSVGTRDEDREPDVLLSVSAPMRRAGEVTTQTVLTYHGMYGLRFRNLPLLFATDPAIGNAPPNVASTLIAARAEANAQRLKVGELQFTSSRLRELGWLVVLSSMFYLFVHVQHVRRDLAAASDASVTVPWYGISEDAWSLVIRAAVFVLLPMFVIQFDHFANLMAKARLLPESELATWDGLSGFGLISGAAGLLGAMILTSLKGIRTQLATNRASTETPQ